MRKRDRPLFQSQRPDSTPDTRAMTDALLISTLPPDPFDSMSPLSQQSSESFHGSEHRDHLHYNSTGATRVRGHFSNRLPVSYGPNGGFTKHLDPSNRSNPQKLVESSDPRMSFVSNQSKPNAFFTCANQHVKSTIVHHESGIEDSPYQSTSAMESLRSPTSEIPHPKSQSILRQTHDFSPSTPSPASNVWSDTVCFVNTNPDCLSVISRSARSKLSQTENVERLPGSLLTPSPNTSELQRTINADIDTPPRPRDLHGGFYESPFRSLSQYSTKITRTPSPSIQSTPLPIPTSLTTSTESQCKTPDTKGVIPQRKERKYGRIKQIVHHFVASSAPNRRSVALSDLSDYSSSPNSVLGSPAVERVWDPRESVRNEVSSEQNIFDSPRLIRLNHPFKALKSHRLSISSSSSGMLASPQIHRFHRETETEKIQERRNSDV